MNPLNISRYSQTSVFLWFLLSCQAGYINVGGLLACHRFVTHTTGFATQFGAEFAQKKWLDAAGMLSVPIFFLVGSSLSAFFVDRRISHGKKANYTFLFFLMCLLLSTVTLFGNLGFFGEFGTPLQIEYDYFLIAILCLVSGIQNAAITSASGAVIRTTHLTGLTTDLGIGLVRMFDKFQSQKKEFRANFIRIALIFGFIMGSTIGAYGFFAYKYLAFIIPVLISLGFCIWSFTYQFYWGRSHD